MHVVNADIEAVFTKVAETLSGSARTATPL